MYQKEDENWPSGENETAYMFFINKNETLKTSPLKKRERILQQIFSPLLKIVYTFWLEIPRANNV